MAEPNVHLIKANELAKDLIAQKQIKVPFTSEWHSAVVALYHDNVSLRNVISEMEADAEDQAIERDLNL